MKSKLLLYIITIVALVISIISLCVACYRNEAELGFDYLGVIVGILAVLVTVLIGLQLYNHIYAREQVKSFIDQQIRSMAKEYEHASKARDFIQNGFEFIVTEYKTERIAEALIKALSEIAKCNNPDMKQQSLDYVMDVAHRLCFVYSKDSGKHIYQEKRSEYLYVLEQIDHKYVSELKDYVINAEEVEKDNHDEFWA